MARALGFLSQNRGTLDFTCLRPVSSLIRQNISEKPKIRRQNSNGSIKNVQAGQTKCKFYGRTCGGAPSVPTVLSRLERHVTYYPHICCTYVDTLYSLPSLKYTVVARLLTCLHLSTSGDPDVMRNSHAATCIRSDLRAYVTRNRIQPRSPIVTWGGAVATQVRSRMATKYSRSNGSFHRVLACSAGGPGFDARLRHNILRYSMERM
jgi:hypothetical protein